MNGINISEVCSKDQLRCWKWLIVLLLMANVCSFRISERFDRSDEMGHVLLTTNILAVEPWHLNRPYLLEVRMLLVLCVFFLLQVWIINMRRNSQKLSLLIVIIVGAQSLFIWLFFCFLLFVKVDNTIFESHNIIEVLLVPNTMECWNRFGIKISMIEANL